MRARLRMAREESGITMVELLVVMVLLGIVMAAVIHPLLSITPVASRDQQRSVAINAQVGLYRVTREVRQA